MRKNSGFTIIELLVTLIVLAVVASFAIPSFNSLMVSNTVSSATDQLFETLIYARAEAVKSGQYVTICKSKDKSTCDNTAAWTDGWLVFVDKNGNGTKDSVDTIVRVYDKLDQRLTVTYTADTNSTGTNSANVIIFNSQGICEVGAVSPISYFGKFKISDPQDTQYDKTISLSLTGRATKG